MPRPVSVLVYMFVAGFYGKLSSLVFQALGAPEWVLAIIAGSVGYSAAAMMETYIDRQIAASQKKAAKDASIVGQ